MDVVKEWNIGTASSDSTFTDKISNLSLKDVIDLWHPYKTDAYQIIYKDGLRNIIPMVREYINKVKRESRYATIYYTHYDGSDTLYLIYYSQDKIYTKRYYQYNWWSTVYQVDSDNKYIPMDGCTTLNDIMNKIKHEFTELVMKVSLVN